MRRSRCGRPLFETHGTVHVEELHFDSARVRQQGPVNHFGRFNWMGHNWAQYSDARRDRLVRNIRVLLANTWFSGICGFEVICFLLVWFLNTHAHANLDWVPVLHACDSDRSRREVLCSMNETARPKHIVRKCNDRLPKELKDAIAEELPSRNDLLDAARYAYQRCRHKMMDHYKHSVPVLMTSPCDLHFCLRDRCLLTTASGDPEGFFEDIEFSAARPLTCSAAGLICVGVAQQGDQLGDASPHIIHQYQWCGERHVEREVFLFTECGEANDAEHLANDLPAGYAHWTMCLDGPDVGDCVRRRRRYTASLDLSEAVVVEELEDFDVVCGRHAVMSFEDFYCLPQKYWQCELQHSLNTRVTPVSQAITFDDLLLPSQRTRIVDYDKLRRKKEQAGKVDPRETWVYDLDHKVDGMPKAFHSRWFERAGRGVAVPMNTTVSHNTWWNTKLKRWMFAMEKGISQCYPILPEWCEQMGMQEFPIDFLALLRNQHLKPTTLSSMFGNGWHLASAGSLFMWFLSSIELRSNLAKLSRPIACEISDDDEGSGQEKENCEPSANTVCNDATTWRKRVKPKITNEVIDLEP